MSYGPYSTVTYSANGTATQYSVPFAYINQADVSATLNGQSASFTWVNSNTIQFASAPAAGTSVVIYRQSNLTNPNVTFADGSTLRAADLNSEVTQLLYGAQEAWDQTLAQINIAKAQTGQLPVVTVAQNTDLLQVVGGAWQVQTPAQYYTTTLLSTGGLQYTTGLSLKLADTSLVLAAGGVNVQLADTSLHTVAGGVGVNLNAASGLSISSGLLILNADTTINVAAGGIKVAPAVNGGLAVNSGLYVRGAQVVTADPGSQADGDQWYNSTSGFTKIHVSGMVLNHPGLAYFSVGPGTAVVNTTTVTVSSSVSLPANSLVQYRCLRVKAAVNYVNTGTPSITVALYANGTSNVLATQTLSISAGTSGIVQVEFLVQVLTTGAGGTAQAFGQWMLQQGGGAGAVVGVNNASQVVNTTQANSFAIALGWSVASASNSATVQYMSVEVLQ